MKSNYRDLQISKQNISYYNGIASQYNALMDKEDSNRLVREWVQGKFKAIGPGKRVMDFGGGTGLDLPWLAGEGHKIFFCEPSIAMKRQAEQLNQVSLKNNNLIFLPDNQTDYTLWPEHSPLPEKVDAVLANFAVINCIPDPASLFRSLATVINPKGHLFALLLDPRKQKNKISQLKNRLNSLILNRPLSFEVLYEGNQQTVFLHTIGVIKRVSSAYFNFIEKETSPVGGFVLIHLTRK